MPETERTYSILNVSSAPDRGDLTARARIRDAAIELFGQRGFERTSVKAIADAAGVSQGLVNHHYGSKEELRRVCDEHVVASLLNESFKAADDPSVSVVQTLAAQVGQDGGGAKFDYIRRMLVEPGRMGDELFDRLVASTARQFAAGRKAGTIQPSSDADVTALIVTVYGLAQFLLRDRLARALGADPLSPQGARKLALPTMELFTHGLYRTDTLLKTTREALAQQHRDSVNDPGEDAP